MTGSRLPTFFQLFHVARGLCPARDFVKACPTRRGERREHGALGNRAVHEAHSLVAALLDGEFTAVACQVPVQIAEYAFNAAQKYVGGDTTIDEKKVYLDSHLVLKDEAEQTVNDWQ